MVCTPKRNIVVRYLESRHSPVEKCWNRSRAAIRSRISFWLVAVLCKMNVMRIIYDSRNSRCDWVTNNTNTNHAVRARVNVPNRMEEKTAKCCEIICFRAQSVNETWTHKIFIHSRFRYYFAFAGNKRERQNSARRLNALTPLGFMDASQRHRALYFSWFDEIYAIALKCEVSLAQRKFSAATSTLIRNHAQPHQIPLLCPVSTVSTQCSSSSAIEYKSMFEKPTNLIRLKILFKTLRLSEQRRLLGRFACSLGDPEPLEYWQNVWQ